MTAQAEDRSGRPDLAPSVIASFCNREVDGLAAVYDHFARPVWSVTMSVLGNRQLAEDAAQETFLKAWNGAARFDQSRPLGPWLMTIARRTALDVHRRESRPTRGGHAQEQEVAINLPGIERAWEVWEIRAALDQLPDEERHVVELAHFGGMSHPQIAERLGVPVGTVKSRSFRAHKRLAALLGHMIDQEGGSQ
ncbi:MAG: sigma-70 family RNA polymerase sigma factor [Actinomycetota bacterium]